MKCKLSMYGYIKESIQDKTKDKLIFYNKKMKGDELFDEIDSLAFYLSKIGVDMGEAVGICLPNIPQAAVSLYAINKIGAIANIIHPKISPNALIDILEKTNTRVIFMFDRTLPFYEKGLKAKGITVIVCSASSYLKGIKKKVAKLFEPEPKINTVEYEKTIIDRGKTEKEFSPYADAVYLHSGGTTGEPKTVVLSSYAFNKLADNVIKRTSINHTYSVEHSMLMALPLFHGFGLGVCIHLTLANFKVVMMPKFSPKTAVKLIKKHKINYLAGIPAMFKKILEEKSFDGGYLSSLKLIFCGADSLQPTTKENFDKILQKNGSTAEILEGYGLSEVASVATVNIKGEVKKGTQGKPINGVSIKILDTKNKECPPNENGNVLIQSEAMMNGYLNNKNMKKYFYVDKNGEKWLKTGDIGCLDEDGYFIFKGREKRVTKIAGVNIFPAEIEKLVCSMKEIDAACVIRAYNENKPCLKLIIKMNKSFNYSFLIEQRLKNIIEEEFIRYAVPKEIIVVKNLQKTLFGKVDYRKYEETDGLEGE